MAPTMGETPPVPPDVSGAMGAGAEKVPFSGVGSMMANKPGATPKEGGVDSQGAFKSAADAVGKVIENMAKNSKSPQGAAFGARMKQMLQAWVSEETKAGPASGNSMAPPPSAKPETGQDAGFVG